MPRLKTIALFIVVVLIAIGGRYAMMHQSAQTDGGKTVHIGGPFTLSNSRGETVTEQTYRGKYMLVYFGYTYCPDVCPTSLQTIAHALDSLPQATQKRIVPIFVSVDPARDKLPVLGEYVHNFWPGMVGLTGTPDQVAAAAKSYRVYYKIVPSTDGDPNDYLMDHSALTYLMGPDGKFITYFAHGITSKKMAATLLSTINATP